MRRPVALALAAATIALATLPACTRSGGTPAPSDQHGAAVRAYGYAPGSGGGVTYQPDVVLVAGGASVIRSLSTDTLTWTIDANAPHASDLAVGKVMFLTSRAVGRVLALHRSGDDLAVTLGPVDLGDVVRDGTLSIHQPLDPVAMTAQTFAGAGGIADVTELSDTPLPPRSPAPPGDVSAVHPSDRSAATTPSLSTADLGVAPTEPPETGRGTAVSVGDFKLEIASGGTAEKGHTDLKISYDHGGVIIGATFAVEYTAPKVDADVSLKGGKLANGSHLLVTGLDGSTMTLQSGSEQGLSRNLKARIEVPVEYSLEIPTEPVPLNLSFEFKFIIETAFSAHDGTLSADGALSLDGPAGFRYQDGYTVDQPAVTVTKRPVDTMAGPSVGVNAVVFAAQFKVTVGLGFALAEVGPFFSLTESYGLTNGSSIGVVHCKQTSLDVVVGGGIGLTIDPTEEGSWLKKVLGPLSTVVPKIESELANISVTVRHAPAWAPDLPARKST